MLGCTKQETAREMPMDDHIMPMDEKTMPAMPEKPMKPLQEAPAEEIVAEELLPDEEFSTLADETEPDFGNVVE